MRRLLTPCAVAALAVAGCGQQPAKAPDAAPAAKAAPPAAPAKVDVPAGAYAIDKAHTSVVFRVDHLGFSHYVGRFTGVDAKLQFDPDNPAASQLQVDIDPRTISADNAPAGFMETLAGSQWLDAGQFPKITFRSTKVEATGPNTGRVTGDFTLHGVTRPVALDVTFNGGYRGHPMDPQARIGFSAKGAFKRSDFGVAYGIPAPGTTMGVGDEVRVEIETEFSGPPMQAAS